MYIKRLIFIILSIVCFLNRKRISKYFFKEGCIIFDSGHEDYYEILSLNHNADNQQIKMAFKKLSIQFHPDKNKDNTLDKYQQIVQAYETLIDPELRQKYDFELA